MTSPTLWQKLNTGGLARNCQHKTIYIQNEKEIEKPCTRYAQFRTKINNDGVLGSKDLTEYTHRCADHTYL